MKYELASFSNIGYIFTVYIIILFDCINLLNANQYFDDLNIQENRRFVFIPLNSDNQQQLAMHY